MFELCVPHCSAVFYPNEPAAIQFLADSLACNLTWGNQIFQDYIMHGCQTAAPGMLLLIFFVWFFELA